jgi:hypothetical protein
MPPTLSWLGVCLFALMFVYSWFNSLADALDKCDRKLCTATTVMSGTLAVVLDMALWYLVIYLAMPLVQSLLVDAVDADADVPSLKEIAFSWLADKRFLGALLVSMAASAAFAYLRVRYEELRPRAAADMRAAVLASYFFSAVMTLCCFGAAAAAA